MVPKQLARNRQNCAEKAAPGHFAPGLVSERCVRCSRGASRSPDTDLAALPDSVRATAHVFHKGEVAWPNDHAEAAINALAAAGHEILGLDARITSIIARNWRGDPKVQPNEHRDKAGHARATAFDPDPLEVR